MIAEPTPLQLLREKLAMSVGENAVFDGWSVKAVETAAAQSEIDPAKARLARRSPGLGSVRILG